MTGIAKSNHKFVAIMCELNECYAMTQMKHEHGKRTSYYPEAKKRRLDGQAVLK